jgi:hypothetical protein
LKTSLPSTLKLTTKKNIKETRDAQIRIGRDVFKEIVKRDAITLVIGIK